MVYVCVCIFIHSAIKKEWNNGICSNMDGSKDFHTKWSKSERKIQIPYGITEMWNLKYDTNELIYEIETDSHREQTCTCQGWGQKGMNWDFGVSRCKLLYIE